MNEARQIFLELKLELLKLVLIQGILNGALLFLGLYALLVWILTLPLTTYLLLIAGGYVIVYCIRELRKIDYATIEEKEPTLRDILRTVYDNKDNKNLIIKALVEELAIRMQEVRPANFFNHSRAFFKMFLVIIIAVSLPFISSYKVQFAQWEDAIRDFTNLIPGFDDPVQVELEEVVFSPEDDIYGDPSVALLGDEEVTVALATSMSNIDFTSPTEANSRKFTDQEAADEVYATTDASYEESIAKNKQKMVREYFKNIQS